ncbi:DUF4272 domain-containing protein [Aureivirga marina]|uniref:DUF4272 domain-containing protein n=1 Tax=Aureivirga marina TaxID=1182451 RepID=UPI0018C9D2D1|nr:DUF4272 domain-containing protein [Aureivirga marina]
MICTFYSHQMGFEKVKSTLQQIFPKGNITTSTEDDFQIIKLENKGGLFKSATKIKFSYREREQPNYFIPQEEKGNLTSNLRGLFNYVQNLPSSNEEIQSRFLYRIQAVNSEFTLVDGIGKKEQIQQLIQQLAIEFNAFLFVQPNTLISKSSVQHFVDKNLNIIIDSQGNCEIEDLEVNIDAKYYDQNQNNLTEDQLNRKKTNELFLAENHIKFNKKLPCVEAEEEVTLRTPKEIATRASILISLNFIAFDAATPEQITNFLKKNNLWEFVTEGEKDFIENPTAEKKSLQTWKCECIWTLLWAINKVNDLGSPNAMCQLDSIPKENYPLSNAQEVTNYINSITETRNKSEILDLNDLYYRYEWACVDARIKNETVENLNPSVVYERHYALNWLINYRNQEWDAVTCDT